MHNQSYVIGIDGGGSKTTAIICTLEGSILAEAQAGSSNYQIVGAEKAADIILNLIENCCHSIGCTQSQIGVVAGIAGAGRLTDQSNLKETILRTSKSLGNIEIESDARIALEGAFAGEAGIVLIAGTGSMAIGKNSKGRVFRTGGWGRIIGDEGSGYAIGREAFRAVARSFDGINRKTKLTRFFIEKFGLDSQEAIIDAVYKNSFDIASAAPLVIAAAEEGDYYAKKILYSSTEELLSILLPIIKLMEKGKKKNVLLSFAGSLLMNESWYTRIIRSLVRRTFSEIRICKPLASPVVGAASMAIQFFKQHQSDKEKV